MLGDYDGAQPLFKALAGAAPADQRYVLQLGLIDAHRGKRAEAAQVSDQLRALERPSRAPDVRNSGDVRLKTPPLARLEDIELIESEGRIERPGMKVKIK